MKRVLVMRNLVIACALALGLVFASGAIIGTNPPALPITAERISTVPSAQRSAWEEYLHRSESQLHADQCAFVAELKKAGRERTVAPPEGRSGSKLPLHQAEAWYSQPEALRIADIVVSFQTPAGGWSKNLDMTQHQRTPGERFSHDSFTSFSGTFESLNSRKLNWSYVGTFDNDATVTQLRYLAKVISSVEPTQGTRYRAAFLRGLDYILAAQFPSGGWPQVWPLQGGYHDSITYNDDAMVNVMELLTEIARGRKEFAFVPQPARDLAAASFQRGLQCILDTQIEVDGHHTVWCQQHDPLTLKPASARNYEMPAQCGSESAHVLLFLMGLPIPEPRVVAAIDSAAAWFEKTALRDVAFKAMGDGGRRLVPSPGGGPIWARYYEIGSDRPLFGDRDKTIHDDVNEISKERRDGYSWFNDSPKRALEEYRRWRQARLKRAGD